MLRRALSLCLALVCLSGVASAQVPDAPSHLTASTTSAGVLLAWDPPPGRYVFVRHVLQAGSTPDSWELGAAASIAPSLFVPDVADGVYYVRVRVETLDGPSPWSQTLRVQVGGAPTCTEPPPAPPWLRVNSFYGNVVVTWERPTGGCAPTSYRLEVGSAPGAANLVITDVGASLVYLTTAPAGTYYARLRAVNAYGVSAPTDDVLVVISAGGTTDDRHDRESP